jgi:DNA-binding transcriptional regulator LsrR (DeoR family)
VKAVLGLKDEGLNNTEIAAHMGISRSSVQRALR